ncbi:MAG: FKBP-type peptidyl-prolyl cis-trans isomerase [Flavobacteriales bacterium]|nr:FKBP-type peptidyl-prolyl cis-trans isomerase [Flavobacteriales bacterium]
MKRILNSVLIFTILILFSCKPKSDYENIAPGLGMKKIEQGTGRGMQNGTDYFYLRAHIFDNEDQLIESATFPPSFYFITQIKEPAYSYDFIKGLPGLKIDDSVSFQSKADSLFLYYYGMDVPYELAGQNVHLHVKIHNILTENEYYEKLEAAKSESKLRAVEAFDSYLQKNNITEKPTGTGTVKKTIKPGNGADAFYGDVVSIHLTQWLFDGKEVENSKKTGGPFEYEIGSKYGMKGLDEALMKMKKGEIAMVYLPYFLAFGEEGQPPLIPPYSNLIMEVEILEIKKPY